MVGHWSGGLGLAGVMACALFAAVSGSVAGDGRRDRLDRPAGDGQQGFPARFGAGVITTSGALGILIPPSIVMVMYAVATNTSVGASSSSPASCPGIDARDACSGSPRGGSRARTAIRASRRRPGASACAHSAKARWGLLLIVVVIGGIYTGIFTPTEAAAMSAVYAFFVAVFVYKDMPLSKVPKVLLDSANMSAMLLYIITNAVMFSYLMTSENIPQAMAAWMLDKGLGVVAFLLVVNVLLLLAGNVMEPSSIVLIFAPILFPVAMKLGIDPVHFGIMMVVNMEVGMCHPPVGLNLYVASGITQDGHHRAHHRGLAVAPDHAGVPADRHLLAGAVALAAAAAPLGGRDARCRPRCLAPVDGCRTTRSRDACAARPKARCFDAASRGRYATDASIYQVMPVGVLVPRERRRRRHRARDRARAARAGAAARRRHQPVRADDGRRRS